MLNESEVDIVFAFTQPERKSLCRFNHRRQSMKVRGKKRPDESIIHHHANRIFPASQIKSMPPQKPDTSN
jgi:hypothetical protein